MAKSPVSVRFYRFSNRLREKTAGLGGEVAEISPEALARAEAALTDMAEDYPDWVLGLVDCLAEQQKACVDEPDERRTYFKEIHRIAHDMKGQGGTFGYPLITVFADSLFGFSHVTGQMSDSQVEIIKAHIDAMRAVIKDRIKGDGGDIGKQLTEELERAIQKHTPKQLDAEVS